MLSIEVCRKMLGAGSQKFSDDEIKEIRETLYQVGGVLVKEFIKSKVDENR